MDRSAQIAQIRRLFELIDAGTTEMGDGIATIPIEEYRCEDRFAREMASVIRKLPIIAATAGELSAPGATVAYDALGVPILLARGQDGVLRGFLNVCRHRNTRIVDSHEVCARRAFKCPYHNWVYGLDGTLKAVPQDFGFPGLDRAQHGLVPVPVEERHGLVWVVGDRAAGIDLDAHLAGLGADLDLFDVGGHQLFRRTRERRRTNWKLIADAFLEAYHVQRLHKDTVAPFFTDNEIATDRLGRHVRSAIARKGTAEMRSLPEDEWHIGEHVSFAYLVFPCTVMVVQPDFLTIITFVPQTAGETEVDHIMLVPGAPRSTEETAHYERAFTMMQDGVFNGEDIWVAEQAQAVIGAGANTHMTLGRFEHNVKFFHDCLNRMIADAPAPITAGPAAAR